MKGALLRSGYLLEHRIETVLRRQGWYVEGSHAYRDSDTGKSRELDLYATRAREIKSRKRRARPDFVWVDLFIECINNAQPLVFLTKRDPFGSGAHALFDIKFVCDPATVKIGKRDQDVRSFLDMHTYQHYCSGRTATQFCSFVRKKDKAEWMAVHEDEHFNAFAALTKAAEDTLSRFKYGRGTYLNATFLYPVLVLQGALIDARHEGARLEFRKEKWIRYRRSLISGKKETTYVIDIVTEGAFAAYLKAVERDARKTAFRMKRTSEFPRANIKNQPKPKSL